MDMLGHLYEKPIPDLADEERENGWRVSWSTAGKVEEETLF